MSQRVKQRAMHRVWLALGALAGLVAVALSAWAAHGLPHRVDAAVLASAQSAITMQGWHALALLATGMIAERGRRIAHFAGGAFALGMVLFCGAVWWGVLMGASLGPVAPMGGTLLMAGWFLLFIAALQKT